MAWTVFVVSLTFIVGIQAYPPACNGTEPWPLEDIAGVDFINTLMRLHMRRVMRSQSEVLSQLSYFKEAVEITYTESLQNTDWKKVQGITPEDAFLCREYASKHSKEMLDEFISSSSSKFVDLSETTSKMEHTFFNYQHPTEDESAERKINIEEAEKAYAAICKISGTLAEDFDQMARDIEDAENIVRKPAAETCYPLIKDV